ncbi:hypothetical protein [Halococcus sp. PRR34]|uniref:hypothetical protein n=1 Tax=Halococcus sp. PRR34 TaxID=3020830 RepID=UPI0023607FAA|nr:hypothetical protein [Halococcus sp. PRR34]
MSAFDCRQAARGTPVGHEGTARCVRAECSAPLSEGSEVAAFVYRQSDQSAFTVGGLYCQACRVGEVRHPTQGAEEYVVHARLGTVADVGKQRHWLAVIDPEVVDSSSPTDE